MPVKNIDEARQILENAREEMQAMRKRHETLATGLLLPENIGPDLLGPQDDLAQQRLIREIRQGWTRDKLD